MASQRNDQAECTQRDRERERHIARSRLGQRAKRVGAVLPCHQQRDHNEYRARNAIAAQPELRAGGAGFTHRYFWASTLPTTFTSAASRLPSASQYLANSGASMYWIGELTLAMIFLKSGSSTVLRAASRSTFITGSGVPLGANMPAQM